MANAVKSKFAGLLRGLLRKLDDSARPIPEAQRLNAVPAAAPAPVSAPVAPVKPNPSSFSRQRAASANEVEIPLAQVIAILPVDLRGKLMSVPPPDMMIAVPVQTVMSQLAFGAVKISFGELRQMVPGLFANSGGEMDNRPVNLPLKEILACLNPALLARRNTEKVAVTEEVSGPFDARGQGITFTTQPLKAPVAAPAPPPAPVRANEPAKPIAFTPSAAPRAVSPANKDYVQATPLTMSQPPFAAPTLPAPAQKISAPPVPAPAVVSMPRPAPASPTIFAALSDLYEHWPEELKDEIIRSPLASASVPLAGAEITAGLKRGRVTMTWKQIRLLIRPSSPVSPNDDLELELPLKVLAPIFFAAQKGFQKPKVAVAADIPDLFFSFPQAAPSVAPPVQPAPTSEPKRKGGETNFYVRDDDNEMTKTPGGGGRPASSETDFTNRQAHPRDVVARAMGLPGVAGAVVSMLDGLCVASQVPADLNADSLAAFLPQIFERLNQATRELRMGALNNVNFTVGNVSWKVFRIGSVYFAAFGRAGESLPSAELVSLAAELDRKKSY